jgi:hypothetical protein
MLNIHSCQRSTNQTRLRFQLTPIRIAIIKKTNNNKCWWRYGRKEFLFTAGGNVNESSHCRNQYGVSSKKLKIELAYDPAKLLDKFPKTISLLKRDTYTPMLITALVTMAKL